jgi:hypothetical protein
LRDRRAAGVRLAIAQARATVGRSATGSPERRAASSGTIATAAATSIAALTSTAGRTTIAIPVVTRTAAIVCSRPAVAGRAVGLRGGILRIDAATVLLRAAGSDGQQTAKQ